jgi:thymidylate kinase
MQEIDGTPPISVGERSASAARLAARRPEVGTPGGAVSGYPLAYGRGRTSRGLFVAFEGIDGAGKSTAAREAASILRLRGVPVTAFDKKEPPSLSAYASTHLRALETVIWGQAPDDPYLELGDDHWIYLQLAWYAALVRCAVEPLLAAGQVVIVDTWAYKFLAKLYLRPGVDADGARSLFARLRRPDLVVHLCLPPQTAAARKTRFSASETGNHEGPVDLSRHGFVTYQTRLAQVLAGLAVEERWRTVDATNLSVTEVADVVALTIENTLVDQNDALATQTPRRRV